MKLNNNNIEIEINDNAEITSIKYKDTEILYQANEGWKKQFPIIFPSLGFSKGFSHNGKEIQMPKHGFWKDLKWESFFENGELLSVATLFDKNKFPFMLDIVQRIGIDRNTVYVNYEITNIDSEDSYFQFGIHPAFQISNLSFISKIPEMNLINMKGELTNETININNLQLSEVGFGEKFDTLIAKNIESKNLTLYAKNMEIEFKIDSTHLQLWKPKEDNFICIEPWYGINDSWYDAPSEVSKKKEIIKLESGRTWSSTLEFSIHKSKKAS